LNAGPSGIAFDKEWQNEGHWEITGHVHGHWSGWEDLLGQLTSAPAAASWQENRLDCFVRGTKNHMWHKSWDGAAWSVWVDLGGPPAPPIVAGDHLLALVAHPVGPMVSFGELASAPAAVSWGQDRIDCFARGTDQHLWHKWWDGSAWHGWEDLGGTLASAPAVASWGPNRLDCFVQGPANHLWHKWWDGAAWSTWEDLGGDLTSAPAVASATKNRLECFVRGTDNHLWRAGWNGSDWSTWEDLGGILTDAPTVVSWGSKRYDCFVRGTNNHMWHKWWGS
jgi:hypothetical protein